MLIIEISYNFFARMGLYKIKGQEILHNGNSMIRSIGQPGVFIRIFRVLECVNLV